MFLTRYPTVFVATKPGIVYISSNRGFGVFCGMTSSLAVVVVGVCVSSRSMDFFHRTRAAGVFDGRWKNWASVVYFSDGCRRRTTLSASRLLGSSRAADSGRTALLRLRLEPFSWTSSLVIKDGGRGRGGKVTEAAWEELMRRRPSLGFQTVTDWSALFLSCQI